MLFVGFVSVSAHHEQVAREEQDNREGKSDSFAHSEQGQEKDDQQRQKASEKMNERVLHGCALVLEFDRERHDRHVVCTASGSTVPLDIITDQCDQLPWGAR